MKRIAGVGCALAGLALGFYAYDVQIDEFHSEPARAASIVAVGWGFLVAGLVAWSRRPGNRLGPLMTATAFALLTRQFRYHNDPLVFTTFYAVGEIGYVMVGHSVLAYPSGRVTSRFERALVAAGYAIVLALPLATLLVYAGTRPLIGYDRLPRESLLAAWPNAGLAELLQKTFVVLLFGALASLFIVAIVRRLVHATPRARRMLAPLLLGAIAVALRAVFECVFTFVDSPFASEYLFWWQISGFIALPLALLAGLMRARLARATVGDLVLELEHTPVGGLRDALARTLHDPTLQLAFWLPERRAYVDATGAAVRLPESDSRRAVTRLEHDGEPVAALVHDPSLLEEPQLVQAAGAAARLALENARLHAEVRAQLAQVQDSRARIVTAADDARRRIERDLHDGAQQRLVALALQLRSAQRRLGEHADPELDRLLASSVDELQAAVSELRDLAHGLHPAILSEAGLAAALESLLARTPFPVSLDVTKERLPEQVESTAYFVACEALANAGKHAGATKVAISARRTDGTLTIEVEDDGVGGAHATNGSGLRGLADRVEALGGRLTIESPAGRGTRIVAEMPCGS